MGKNTYHKLCHIVYVLKALWVAGLYDVFDADDVFVLQEGQQLDLTQDTFAVDDIVEETWDLFYGNTLTCLCVHTRADVPIRTVANLLAQLVAIAHNKTHPACQGVLTHVRPHSSCWR